MNLTPFTTRPAFTSRQGMMRLAGMILRSPRGAPPRPGAAVRESRLLLRGAHRVGEHDPSLVERLPDDDAGEPGVAAGGDVGEARDAARGDHRQACLRLQAG